jgi:hypothetical protein
MLTKTFSEMLLESGLPFTSKKGFGFPGLHANSTPTGMNTQASNMEIRINTIRLTFDIND